LRERSKAEDDAYRKKVITGRQLFPLLASHGFGVITYALIIASVGVFCLSNMGNDWIASPALFIGWQPGLAEIRHGRLWRLVSPILIHFGIAHILLQHALAARSRQHDGGSAGFHLLCGFCHRRRGGVRILANTSSRTIRVSGECPA
jgi:hypothetical protein